MILRPPHRSGTRPCHGPHRGQRGQALVWLLGTMAASAALLYGVYNVGQITSAKQKTLNAADASALAGATVEARMLNLMAYNNRSLIANEVFVIQVVAMEGWFQYVQNTADHIEDYARWIPYIGTIVSRVLTVIEEAVEAGEEALNGMLPVMIGALELMKSVTAVAHEGFRTTGSVMAQDAAKDVVTANRAAWGKHEDVGPQVEDRGAVKVFTTVRNFDQWRNFTRRYSGNDRKDAADILKASRDEFTGRSRPGAFWMTPSLGLVGFEKMGSTELKSFDRWETQDTYEFWNYGFCKSWKKCYTEIGWGRSNLDRNGSRGSRWSPGRDAQSDAYSDGHTHGGWSGVPAVYDIADKTTANRETLGLDFVMAVKRNQSATLTSSTMGVAKKADAVTGSVDMDERLLGQQVSALSKARVYFERPQSTLGDKTATALFRHDGAKEYGSLFSPFWQARLTPVTTTERTAYMTALGMNPVDAAATAAFSPGGSN
jgi:Putative Flp pilus-assembly TadE/G-like